MELTYLFVVTCIYSVTSRTHNFVRHSDVKPPMPLSPLRTTNDVRYDHFTVPAFCIRCRISFSATLEKHCQYLNLSLFLRPLSLPVVTAFDVDAPLGVIFLPDMFHFKISSTESASYNSIVKSAVGFRTDISSSNNKLRISGEVNLYSPIEGSWFLGSYFTSPRETGGCYVTLFPQVTKEIVTEVTPIILLPSVSRKSASTGPNVSTDQAVTVKPSSGRSRSRSGFEFPLNRYPLLDFYPQTALRVPRHLKSQSITAKLQGLTAGQTSHIDLDAPSSTYVINNRTWLLTELSPGEERVFKFAVIPEMTSVDFAIDRCNLLSAVLTSTKPSDRLEGLRLVDPSSTSTRGVPSCPVAIDGGIGYLPRDFSDRFRESFNLSHQYTTVEPRTSSLNFSDQWTPQKSFRFDLLHDIHVSHYFYVRNLDRHLAVLLNMSFLPNFACTPSVPSDLSSSYGYANPKMNKIFTRLPASPSKSSLPEVTRKDQHAAIPPSRIRALSLLKWVNPDWPVLIPQKTKRSKRLSVNRSLNDLFVVPELAEHRPLDRCFIWPAPSRISRMHAFAFHFTYQSWSGQAANGLRISPWNVIAIPITLEPGLDTGGSLEISLQLNAFDLTASVNDTHSKPPARQVILHACFARHLATTPHGFTDAWRCPIWFRLATSRGIAVSVAEAVSRALLEAVAISRLSHRSEVPPSFNTSFSEDVDRSFIFLPYPPPGQWYLSLYAECYSEMDMLCSQDPGSTVDVGLVIRSSPCLNYRCRDTGEGASLPPSRLMDPKLAEPRPIDSTVPPAYVKQGWRPPWWPPVVENVTESSKAFHHGYAGDQSLTDEGLCVELLQNSVFASMCVCPPGRTGMGCVRPKGSNLDNQSFSEKQDENVVTWSGYSDAALWLSLSNLAFLPVIFVALLRRLWIPALIYSYTSIFSALYHLCDTDILNIPFRAVTSRPSSGSVFLKTRGYQFLYSDFSSFRSVPLNFQFSPVCLLPLDVLSFCDFFGGVLSMWVTVVVASACPLYVAQMAYVIFILTLTVAVHMVRYSSALFLVPSLLGLLLLTFCWTIRSRQTGRLFPPIQWWVLSLLPGLFLASIGLLLFLSPSMSRNYTRLHSLWHTLMGVSLLGLLPWPGRWRTALSPVVPLHIPLSCGGTISHCDCKNVTQVEAFQPFRFCISWQFSSVAIFSRVDLGSRAFQFSRKSSCFRRFSHLSWLLVWLCRVKLYLKTSYQRLCFKLDKAIELNGLLDAVVERWPKCYFLLPYGYVPRDSTQPLEQSTVPDPCTCGSAHSDPDSQVAPCPSNVSKNTVDLPMV